MVVVVGIGMVVSRGMSLPCSLVHEVDAHTDCTLQSPEPPRRGPAQEPQDGVLRKRRGEAPEWSLCDWAREDAGWEAGLARVVGWAAEALGTGDGGGCIQLPSLHIHTTPKHQHTMRPTSQLSSGMPTGTYTYPS